MSPAASRAPQSRTTEEAGEVAAARGAGARRRPLARFARAAGVRQHAARPGSTSRELALHDAQSVIAREHGFASWNALREEVEARTLTFEAAVEEFVRCATGGAAGRAERLLALHPGDRDAPRSRRRWCSATPRRSTARLARASGTRHGRRRAAAWEPLLYVCHTCLHRRRRRRASDGLVAIARRLLRARRESERRISLELASGTAAHGAVGRGLRGRGTCRSRKCCSRPARIPTDGVTAHIAAGGGNLAALELLHRFGAGRRTASRRRAAARLHDAVDGQPGGPALAARARRGPESRLGRSRDEAPLHVAARRWDVPMVELLVHHGADPLRRRADGRTPHTLAALQRQRATSPRGCSRTAPADELTPLERFVAACARGDRARADAHARRAARAAARSCAPEHHLMLQRPAESGDAAVLETMLGVRLRPERAATRTA